MDTPEQIRQKIDKIIKEKGLNYRAISVKMGRADSYMQQYIKRGFPSVLKEKERAILSRILGVPEQELTNIPLSELTSAVPVKPIYKVGYVQAGKFKTTLICCPLEDWIEINPETSLEGKYIITYRRAPDGTCEATVKKYTRIDETTVILVAESSNPDIKPIILHPDSNEYEIAAVVIGDLRIY